MAELYKDFADRVKDCNQADLTDKVARAQKAHHFFCDTHKKLVRAKREQKKIDIAEAGYQLEVAETLEKTACQDLLITLKLMRPNESYNALKGITALTFITWYYHIGNPVKQAISNPFDYPDY
jgi:hypothetical protein